MVETLNQSVQYDRGNMKCTFEVSVRYMQNATWQGEIHWIEKNQRQCFRSVLEMIKLMDKALAEGTERSEFGKWVKAG